MNEFETASETFGTNVDTNVSTNVNANVSEVTKMNNEMNGEIIEAEVLESGPDVIAVKDLVTELGVTRRVFNRAMQSLAIEAHTIPGEGRQLFVTGLEADLIRERIAGKSIAIANTPTVPDFGEYLAGAELGTELAIEALEKQAVQNGETQERFTQVASQAGQNHAQGLLEAYARSAAKTLIEGRAEIDAALAKYLGKP